MSLQTHEIKQLFKTVFNNRPNPMTPDVIRYGQKRQFAFEISSGEFMGRTMYGVTVINTLTKETDRERSQSFTSLADCESFIAHMFQSDRDRVNAAIKNTPFVACVPVSESFVEEMRDCVPPQTMKSGLYSIIQVGEISRHNQAGQALYETYMMMNEEAVRLDMGDSRMEVGQWYFMGLKPAIE